MQKEKIFRERIKFYADTPRGEKNKLFCFDTSVLTLKETVWRFFNQGWSIRSAWYENINLTTGEVIENTKLNVQSMFEEWCDEQQSAKKTKTLH